MFKPESFIVLVNRWNKNYWISIHSLYL